MSRPCYIYIVKNEVNGKRYIGKKVGRPETTRTYLGSGKLIRSAIDKYGRENFSKIIIEELEDLVELAEREKFWIKEYDAVSRDDFYNISYGAGVPSMSDEAKKKQKETWKKKLEDGYVVSISSEARSRAGITRSKRNAELREAGLLKRSEQSRQKLIETNARKREIREKERSLVPNPPKKPRKKPEPKIRLEYTLRNSKTGEIVQVIDKKEFAKQHGLQVCEIYRVASGAKKSYRGWELLKKRDL